MDRTSRLETDTFLIISTEHWMFRKTRIGDWVLVSSLQLSKYMTKSVYNFHWMLVDFCIVGIFVEYYGHYHRGRNELLVWLIQWLMGKKWTKKDKSPPILDFFLSLRQTRNVHFGLLTSQTEMLVLVYDHLIIPSPRSGLRYNLTEDNFCCLDRCQNLIMND